MEIISGTNDFYIERETAVAIGKFDGVHIGHRRLLEEILNKKQQGLLACVFTFEPSPSVFFGREEANYLTTKEEKRLLFERMGVDLVIEFPMTKENASMEPETFVREILAEKMQTRFLVAGTDVSFGAGGRGDRALLDKMSDECGFEVRTIEKVKIGEQIVSSTYAKSLLEKGEIRELQRFLGMPYPLFGTVVHGKALGRTIGFPTVNILPPEEKLLPPLGVYLSEMIVGEKKYRGITNIGYKPTVTDEHVCGAETYLYDFNSDIYGEEVELYLLDFLRPERKFESLDALKAQLQIDIETGRPKDKI